MRGTAAQHTRPLASVCSVHHTKQTEVRFSFTRPVSYLATLVGEGFPPRPVEGALQPSQIRPHHNFMNKAGAHSVYSLKGVLKSCDWWRSNWAEEESQTGSRNRQRWLPVVYDGVQRLSLLVKIDLTSQVHANDREFISSAPLHRFSPKIRSEMPKKVLWVLSKAAYLCLHLLRAIPKLSHHLTRS